MKRARTIAREVSLRGRGFIHNQEVTVRFHPASAGTGIVFVRRDLVGSPAVRAEPHLAQPGINCTTLKQNGAEVLVIEHVMAALYAFGICNLVVELDGAELPTFDGSAKPYAEVISQVGVVEQEAKLEPIHLLAPIILQEGEEALLLALPSEQTKFSYFLNYPQNPVIGTGSLTLTRDNINWEEEVLPARTFIPLEEARRLLELGHITSQDETMGVVIREELPPLRMPLELVRHKLLDLSGDLWLYQKEVRAHFIGIRSGHRLNIRMATALRIRYL